MTVADLFDQFVRARNLRESTAKHYRYNFDAHIRPAIGSWSLRNLDVPAVEKWWAQLDAGPEGPSEGWPCP